ncbi:MAG: NAD(P)-binding domain-containing protein [Rhodoferax sp.]|nr:NAD(P)-binding domain-containing protein [Rhodoferax sp.]
MPQLAFLGTGLLGAAFAEAAAKRGDSVSVWNRSADKARALEAFGITVAASPAEAVRGATRVHIVLKDDAVVEDVLAQARAGLAADVVVIDHTTTLPALTGPRLERFNAQGIRYLHCPVFMGPAAARAAQGSMMASGPQALFDSVQAELARMTGKLHYLGERSDLAAINKLFGNALIVGLGGVIADVLSIAGSAKVSGEDAVKLFGMLDLNLMAQGIGTTMAKRNFTPTFELSMARKDVGLMLQTAGPKPMAALPGIAARMDQLIAAGHGSKGTGVMAIDAG